MFAKTLIAAALVLAPSIGATAFAATNQAIELTSAEIRTNDLNLTTASGKATLNARIASAVNRVCGATGGTTDLQERLAVNQCRAKSRREAMAAAEQLGQSALAAR